ncbi:MAG: hypothetical protein WCW14_00240 [Candidatus Paceibacterota bacterium]|jgi:hypothetical protein
MERFRNIIAVIIFAVAFVGSLMFFADDTYVHYRILFGIATLFSSFGVLISLISVFIVRPIDPLRTPGKVVAEKE